MSIKRNPQRLVGPRTVDKCRFSANYRNLSQRSLWGYNPASNGFSRPDAMLWRERYHCEQLFAFPLSMYMLWFIFFPWFKFCFLCLKLIVIHYHTPKQRKTKFKPRKKLNHNIYIKTSNDITFFWFPGIIRNFRIQQHDSNEKIKITICRIKQNHNLHLHHSFLHISLLFAN